MNTCKIIACREWRTGLSTVFSRVKPRTNRRCPEAAPSLSRGQATAANHAPGSDTGQEQPPGADTGEKPRLRAIDLARKVQQEKAKVQQEKAKPQQEKAKPQQEKAKPQAAAAAAAAEEPRLSGQQKRLMDLKRFSQQLQNVHPNVLAKHLHKSLLYQDKDVVIINKPYGVPVGDDSGVTSISSVLPVLSKMMDGMKIKSDSRLLPCLTLEKETPGALLLARREEVVEHILNLNRNNQLERKYWVITVGRPIPSDGVIDIPVIEREVTGSRPHYKMALSPLFRMNDSGDGVSKVRASRQAHAAVTKYRVLDSSGGCSLVELQPYTGAKHQMRVHMALALTCPILGDHKYSNWSKLAPQKLPERVLRKLGLEQSKARHLPLHVFARQLTLPGTNQPDISVSCPLPKYFSQTMRQLNLTLPDEKEEQK